MPCLRAMPTELLTSNSLLLASYFHSVRFSPVEDFQLHGSSAVELIDLWSEGEIETSDRQRAITRAPPDRFVSRGAVSHPHLHVSLVGANPLQRTAMSQIARAELDRRIPLSGGPKAIEFVETRHRDLFEP